MSKIFRNIFLLFCVLLLSVSGADSQVVEVKAWLDSTVIKIGEKIGFHLELRKKISSDINTSKPAVTFPVPLEVIGDPVGDTSKIQGTEVVTLTYYITAFDSGNYEIPEVPVAFVYQDIRDTIYTNALELSVYYPEVDTTQGIKDIKPPLNTPVSFAELLPVILIVVVILVLIAVAVYIYLRFRKKKPIFIKSVEKLPAHVIAFAELDKLKEEKLWQKGKVKEFYSRLSDIIRIYLENRYNFRSMECVTDEIMKDFRKINQEQDVDEMLSELLHTSDMVKFAKADPLPAENQSIFNNAYFIVEKTRLREMKSLEELAKENVAESNPV